MMEQALNFINHCIQSQTISEDDLEQFRKKIISGIEINVHDAATMQVNEVRKAMEEVKQKLGPQAWSELFVVVNTIWPVSQESPREQIFKDIMDPDKVKTHLIIAEGIRDIEEARTLIGRIAFDRYTARKVFGIDTEKHRDFATALSTPLDLMSQDATLALQAQKGNADHYKLFSHQPTTSEVCPFAGNHHKKL